MYCSINLLYEYIIMVDLNMTSTRRVLIIVLVVVPEPTTSIYSLTRVICTLSAKNFG